MATPWRIVFMGTPQIAAATLEELMHGPDLVVGVVTQPDRPAGRGQQTIPTPVRKSAQAHDLPVIDPAHQTLVVDPQSDLVPASLLE